MKTYKITVSTDPYHASRNGFPRSGVKVLDEGLSLKQANKKIFDYFTWAIEDKNIPYFSRWCDAVRWTNAKDGGVIAYHTTSDGRRSFVNDVFTYDVEEEHED